MKRFPAVIFILISLILLSSCASIHRTFLQGQKISLPDAEKIISGIEEQGDMVRSFYALGGVSIKGWILESDADILIAGIKDPFTMKIEITHPWGKPILHVLIKDGRLEVLSFQEKVKYLGAFTPEALSRFLPGFLLDQTMIWSILSGRPPILMHGAVRLPGTDRISLTDADEKELEAIYLPIAGYLPEKISFPKQSLDVSFSDVKENSGIAYAGEIKLRGKKIERDLTLNIKKLAFNGPIADQIFTLEKPSTYETINLDDLPVDAANGNPLP